MIRGALGLLTALGVGNIIDNAIKMVTPVTQMKPIQKMAHRVGGFALSMFVADKVAEHVDNMWTETEDHIKNLMKRPVKEEVIEEEVK